MNQQEKIKVFIKVNSFWAFLAARKLKTTNIALVIGRTIFLHQTTAESFLSSKRWLLHELKHVQQFQRLGRIKFLWKYLNESISKGYYQNALEVEARDAETDLSLLDNYEIIIKK